MRDQVTNRIELIMQEHKPTFIDHVEQISMTLLLVVFFLFGVSIWADYTHPRAIACSFRALSSWTLCMDAEQCMEQLPGGLGREDLKANNDR